MSEIQVIRRDVKFSAGKTKITYSSIDRPRALDDFDINIIDLNDEYLWRNNDKNNIKSDYDSDYISISKMIKNCTKSTIIILLPENFCFKYYLSSTGKYYNSIMLKDMIPNMKGIVEKLVYEINFAKIEYENTITTVGGISVKAAFCFYGEVDKGITYSDKSNKMTTILSRGIYISALCLDDEKKIIAFLNEIGLIKNKSDVPEWFAELDFFDDADRKSEILDIDTQIKQLQEQREIACNVLEDNNRYKSILYTNGDELVGVVFDILQELLGCDLSGFVDEKKEDFLFELEGKTYIGEIKGINTNVKSEFISQLDVHVNGYLDDNPDKTLDDVVALLVINDQKKKSIMEREPVHKNQIALAKRNGSLIIQTKRLLEILSDYRGGKIDRQGVIKILSKKGIL